MTRLLLAELRATWASWSALIAVAAVAALSIGVALSLLETGLRAGGEYRSGFAGGTAMILIFSGPSAVAVTASISRLAVDLGRPRAARWQLAGVSPAQTALLLLSQMAGAGLLGAAVGVGLTALLAEPVVHRTFEDGSGGYTEIPVVVGPITVLGTVAVTVGIVLLGGARAAIAGSHSSPLLALREPEPEAKLMRWWRWLLLAGVLAAVSPGIVALAAASSLPLLISVLPLIPALLTVPLIALGPVLLPALLRGWTALVPARASSVWFLARHQARFHVGRSTASITPLFVGVAVFGGFATMVGTLDAALRGSGDRGVNVGFWQAALLFGGPVLLAAVGAAGVLFMSNRTQGGEQALLVAAGAGPGTVLASACWQAVITVGTAALLAGAVIVATALLSAALLSRVLPAVPVITPGPGLALLGVGLGLTLLATVLPVLTRSRTSLVSRLPGAR